jgi:hypothetical protein
VELVAVAGESPVMPARSWPIQVSRSLNETSKPSAATLLAICQDDVAEPIT